MSEILADFIAFALDALTSLGGYPGDDEKGLALFQELDRGKMTEDFPMRDRAVTAAAHVRLIVY